MSKDQWSDFEKYVIKRIDDIDHKLGKTHDVMNEIDKKVTGIRAKAAVAASFISAICAGGWHILVKKLNL